MEEEGDRIDRLGRGIYIGRFLVSDAMEERDLDGSAIRGCGTDWEASGRAKVGRTLKLGW